MESICPVCKKPYDGVVCPKCTVTDLDVTGLMASDGLQVNTEDGGANATAFLVDLVSNRKIPITTPRCKVGRDDLNDIVISGDQSISRFHFVIAYENGQYSVQDGKSRHGTFLNGNQITNPEPIHDGDVLKVGVSLFWFVIETQAAGASGDKFAPVDIETIDKTELEVVVPEPAQATQAPAAKGKGDGKSLEETSLNIPVIGADATLMKGTGSDKAPEDKAEKSGEKEAEEKPKAENPKAEEPSKAPIKPSGKLSEADRGATIEINLNALPPDIAPDMNLFKKSSKKEMLDDESFVGSYQMSLDMLLDPLLPSAEDEKKGAKPEPASAKDDDKKSEAPEAKKDEKPEPEPELKKEEPKSEPEPKKEESKPEPESKKEDSKPEPESKKEEAEAEPELKKSEPEPELKSSFNEGDWRPEKYQAQSPLGTVDYSFGISESDISRAAANLGDSLAQAKENEESAEEAEGASSGTLEKFAEIIGEAEASGEKKASPEPQPLSNFLNFQSSTDKVEVEEPKKDDEKEPESSSKDEQPTSNGAKSVMSIVKEPGTVPDWCKRYFSSELNHLSKELTELSEQVRMAQQKIKEVESRVALTKGLRNTLLAAQGDDLVEACGKVLTMLGFKVNISDEDKHELKLEVDDKNISIARIVWTDTQADRTHLGQLSISQTRYWCEKGVEPKGILIISKTGNEAPTPLSSSDYTGELAEYASKKNVCLMTTLQLLAVYKEVALNDGSAEGVKQSIHNCNGWLPGYSLEPGDGDNEPSGGTNKLSSLLSA